MENINLLVKPTTWPIAVVQDRYHGIYSGGLWLAIADAGYGRLDFVGEQEDAHGDDCEAMDFWSDPPEWIAVGNSPDEAVRALLSKLEKISKSEP